MFRFGKDYHKKNIKQHLLQPLIGAIFIIVLSFGVNTLFSVSIIAALGATTFIVTTLPKSKLATPKYLIGGYLCGILSAVMCFYLQQILPIVPQVVIIGLGVAITIILGVGFRVEHPPSAAVAISLMLSDSPVFHGLIAIACVIIISVAIFFLKKYMINLI